MRSAGPLPTLGDAMTLSAPPTASPPGWHPDPWGHAPLRWWDGAQWSPWVSAGPGPWEAYAPDGQPVDGRRWFPDMRTLRWPAAVLATVLVVLTVAGNFAVAGFQDDAPLAAGLVGLVVLGVSVVGFPLSGLVASRAWGSRRFRADVGLRFRPIDLALGLGGAVAMFVTLVAVGLLLQALGVPQASNLEPYEDVLTGPVIVLLLVLAGVLAPIGEELLFRGVLLRGLMDRWTGAVAVVAQGVLFGFAHVLFDGGWGNVGLVIPLAMLGLILGFLARATGRLGAGMIAHSLFNVSQILLLVATKG